MLPYKSWRPPAEPGLGRRPSASTSLGEGKKKRVVRNRQQTRKQKCWGGWWQEYLQKGTEKEREDREDKAQIRERRHKVNDIQ